MMKFDKVKLSRHQRENLDTGKPGHNYAEFEAEHIIATAPNIVSQEDGRLKYEGSYLGKAANAVVSAAQSAAYSIARVVTAHRVSKRKV